MLKDHSDAGEARTRGSSVRVKHSTAEPLTPECTFMRGAKQNEMFEISDLRRRETLHLRSVHLSTSDGGGGGVKILNFNIFGDFQKIE